jgi:hypothetical protein
MSIFVADIRAMFCFGSRTTLRGGEANYTLEINVDEDLILERERIHPFQDQSACCRSTDQMLA